MPTPPRRNTVITGVVLAIAGVLFLLLILGGIALVRSYTRSTGEAGKVADRFLTALETRDLTAANALLTPEVQQVTSADGLGDVIGLMEKRHGAAKSHSGPTGSYVNSYNGLTTVRLSYQEQFQNGTANINFLLAPGEGGWQIKSFHFSL